jgi:cytochrome c oxidase subunit 2
MDEEVMGKVSRINTIRRKNSLELMAKGEEALEPYEFDYYCFATRFVVPITTICK